jgi:hypothetical protein
MFHRIIEKLFTHEDSYNIHKSLGLMCLLNYGYQYYLYFRYNQTILNIYTLAPHFLLHASSFIFKVLEYRQTESRLSMFIWKEMRLHSLIFAWRACFCILFVNYCQIITFIAILCADYVTNEYGTIGVSTIRGVHDNIDKRNFFKKVSGAFFSISQLGATAITSGIFQPFPSKILIFSTLPPIQTSAFGMTLLRKNLISKNTWLVIYSIELLFVYLIWYCEYKNLYIIPLSILLYIFRRLNISKYLIWGNMFVINNMFFDKIKN